MSVQEKPEPPAHAKRKLPALEKPNRLHAKRKLPARQNGNNICRQRRQHERSRIWK
ncbi:hypothetical protein BRYFOR_09021 [Marvinbryantia formatexigens DSM 14469]|uniref:Uncharacterized protein n=1 Tax=Marvinbryantia formatexigens DSM 14469 TaxID=478749 RepID=C6LK34_9FIRM|nr:hypothetical protein BRYFOR_09021 [Marvinbryantia formatexigens DSM 14469]